MRSRTNRARMTGHQSTKNLPKTNINDRIFLFMMRFEPTIINSFSVSIHIQLVKVIKVYRTVGLGHRTESPQTVDDIGYNF